MRKKGKASPFPFSCIRWFVLFSSQLLATVSDSVIPSCSQPTTSALPRDRERVSPEIAAVIVNRWRPQLIRCGAVPECVTFFLLFCLRAALFFVVAVGGKEENKKMGRRVAKGYSFPRVRRNPLTPRHFPQA